MKIAVIGAGPVGILTTKYILEKGYVCDVFEQSGEVGGCWVSTNNIEMNEYGIEKTSIYRDLITNSPKEVMCYRGSPFSESIKESYISQSQVLEYYNFVADSLNIKQYVQYYSKVVNVLPIDQDKWSLHVQNLKSKKMQSFEYNFVFICNGRFSKPYIPKILGENLFEGNKSHSCNFKTTKPFIGQKVLMVGDGISAVDLVPQICAVSEQIFLSGKQPLRIPLPKNVTEKPEVSEFIRNGAIFVDESLETFDTILYCTGYEYVCPFVTKECGVIVENNGVTPLYKHVINIERPTMYFISLMYPVSGIPLAEIQILFAIAAMEKKIELPSKRCMIKEFDEYMSNVEKKGVPKKHFHRISTTEESKKYSLELSQLAKVTNILPVIFKIYDDSIINTNKNCTYKILDDDNFTIVL